MTETIVETTANGQPAQSKQGTHSVKEQKSKASTNFPAGDGELTLLPKPAATCIAEALTPMNSLQQLGRQQSGFTGERCHPQLLSILQTKRAHNSVGDYLFRASLLQDLSQYKPTVVGEGNIVVKLGKGRVAFSCHVDTCHSKEESDGSFQTVNEEMGLLTLGSRASCLGADDGIGIFLMLQMIQSEIPGTYIFHTAEEVGAAGSLSINSDCQEFTQTFDLIVAFDRAVLPGQAPEVIVTQAGKACASVQCGQTLADALNLVAPDLGFVVSHRGLFTDTLNYADNVAEALNLGCYYWDQHSAYECVDVGKVNILLQAVLAVSWQDLPVVRKPEKVSLYGEESLQADLQLALKEALEGDPSSINQLVAIQAAAEYGLTLKEAAGYLRNSFSYSEIEGCLESLSYLDPETALIELFDTATAVLS